MASHILTHSRTQNQRRARRHYDAQRAARVLNVARIGRRWFVELAALSRYDYLRRAGGRVAVTPEIGRAMVAAAKREGAIAHVHCWGVYTTWHLQRGQR